MKTLKSRVNNNAGLQSNPNFKFESYVPQRWVMLQVNLVLRFFVIVVLCLILEHSAQAISVTPKSLFTYIESLNLSHVLWGKGSGVLSTKPPNPSFQVLLSPGISLWQKTLMRNYALCLRVKEAKESLIKSTLCCSLTDFDLHNDTNKTICRTSEKKERKTNKRENVYQLREDQSKYSFGLKEIKKNQKIKRKKRNTFKLKVKEDNKNMDTSDW